MLDVSWEMYVMSYGAFVWLHVFHSEFILNYMPDEIKNKEFGEHVRFQNAAEFGGISI